MYLLLVKMGISDSSAALWRTRSWPAVLRHSATSVVGTQQMASPNGSTPT